MNYLHYPSYSSVCEENKRRSIFADPAVSLSELNSLRVKKVCLVQHCAFSKAVLPSKTSLTFSY
jgi:hypothetical protein